MKARLLPTLALATLALAGLAGCSDDDGKKEVVRYTLTVTAPEHGAVTLDPPGGTYAAGTPVVVTATPAAGWDFAAWTGAITGTASPAVVVMDGNKLVGATFVAEPALTYTLSVAPQPHGTVTLEPPGPTYAAGTVVTATATAAPGWDFGGWFGAAAGAASPTTVTMDANKAIGALFVQEAPPLHPLTITPTPHGTVTVSPPSPDYAGVGYFAGTYVVLTAVPDAGYDFAGWSGTLTGTANPAVLRIDGPTTVTASFVAEPPPSYTLTVTAPVNGTLTLTPPGGVYAAGTQVTVTATPATEYAFQAWTGDGTGTARTTTITMDADRTVGATFFHGARLVLAPVTNGTVTYDPPVATGDWVEWGTDITVTATPGAGYALDAAFKMIRSPWPNYLGESFGSPYTLTVDLADRRFSATASEYTIGAYFVPADTWPALDETLDVEYAKPGWKPLRYDVYAPAGAAAARASLPMVFIVHGGGWASNNEDIMRGQARYLAQTGRYVVVSLDYRLTSDLVYPGEPRPTYVDMIEDVYGAIAHAQEHAAGYGGDPGRIAVTGDSAGGHLAAITTLQALHIGDGGYDGTIAGSEFLPSYLPALKTVEDVRDEIVAALDASAPSYGVFAARTGWDEAITPAANIPLATERRLVPQHCQVGSNDPVVRPATVQAYVDALVAAGQPAQYLEIPGASHAYLDWKPEAAVQTTFHTLGEPALDQMIAFFDGVFYPPQATLVLTAPENGTIAASPAAPSYDRGATVTVTATPAAGYRFTGWTGDLTGTENPASLVMDGDRTLSATFAAQAAPFLVTVVPPLHGAITLDPPGGAYAAGTIVTVTAIPEAGHGLSAWTGALATGGTATLTRTLTVNADATVGATFGTLVTLSVTEPTNGTITLDPPGGLYGLGARVNVTAVPAPEHSFQAWTGDLATAASSPAPLVMNGDRTVGATFFHGARIVLAPVTNGTVVVDPPVASGDWVPWGTEFTITATPAAGFELDAAFKMIRTPWPYYVQESFSSPCVAKVDLDDRRFSATLREYTLGAYFVPAGTWATLDETHDVVYAQPGWKALKYDVYRVRGAANLPIVVIVHGGGWSSNNEDIMRGQARHLAQTGRYVVVSIDYRLTSDLDAVRPTNRDQLEDVFGALAHVQEHAASYGGDPARLAVTGDSAGGHLSALAANAVDRIGEAGYDGTLASEFVPTYVPAGMSVDQVRLALTAAIRAAAPSYGVFVRTPDALSPTLQIPDVTERVLPPQHCQVGSVDPVVRPAGVRAYVQALLAAGQQAEYFEVAGASHAYFDWKPEAATQRTFKDLGQPALNVMVDFFDSVFYPPAPEPQ